MDTNDVKALLTPGTELKTQCGYKATILRNDLRSTHDILAVIEVLPHHWQTHAKPRDVVVQFPSNGAKDDCEQLLSLDTGMEKIFVLELKIFKKQQKKVAV